MKTKGVYRYFYVILPLILLFLFFKNIYTTETYKMDPWLGGGMRMFSSVDHTGVRIIGFYTKHQDSLYYVNLKNFTNLHDKSLKARILPNDKRLQDLKNIIEQQKWCVDNNGNIIPCTDKDSDLEIDLKVEKLVVYRINYSINNKELNLKLLREYTPK